MGKTHSIVSRRLKRERESIFGARGGEKVKPPPLPPSSFPPSDNNTIFLHCSSAPPPDLPYCAYDLLLSLNYQIISEISMAERAGEIFAIAKLAKSPSLFFAPPSLGRVSLTSWRRSCPRRSSHDYRTMSCSGLTSTVKWFQ